MKNVIIYIALLVPFACMGPGNAKPEGQLEAENEATLEIVVPPLEGEPDWLDSLPGAARMEFPLEYLMGQFEPGNHPDFVGVDRQYTDGDAYFLRKDTYKSFQKMWDAAKADGVELKIISATRNFYRQKSIWEAKWTGIRKIENGTNAPIKYPDPKTRALKILEYSSMPGTSRHHWGTDIDLNSLDNFNFEQGNGKKVYEWLVVNAARFGFCQPYSPKGEARPYGYNEEKWHWSYLPVARQLTDLAKVRLTNEMISGFQGAESAISIGVIEKYVLGINAECKK